MNSFDLFAGQSSNRRFDVCALENPLLDLLIKGTDADIEKLGMTKGVMQLVDAHMQSKIFANMHGTQPEIELGGSAANAMRGMAMLGSKTAFAGTVGQDANGKLFAKRMQELGIHSCLNTVVQEQTGTCLVVVTPDGDRTLNTHLGACRSFDKLCVPESDIKQSKVLFTTGYVWDSDHQIDAIEHALKIAILAGTKIALDVADPFVVHRSGKRLRTLIDECVDIVFANADEAKILVGCTGSEAAKILSAGRAIAVVKDGKNGAYVGHNNTIVHVPAPAVTVVDTTGAGDMFAAGFLHGICNGMSLQIAGEIGTILASDTITHLGVRLSDAAVTRAKAVFSAH